MNDFFALSSTSRRLRKLCKAVEEPVFRFYYERDFHTLLPLPQFISAKWIYQSIVYQTKLNWLVQMGSGHNHTIYFTKRHAGSLEDLVRNINRTIWKKGNFHSIQNFVFRYDQITLRQQNEQNTFVEKPESFIAWVERQRVEYTPENQAIWLQEERSKLNGQYFCALYSNEMDTMEVHYCNYVENIQNNEIHPRRVRVEILTLEQLQA